MQRLGFLEWALRAGRLLCRVLTQLETWSSFCTWRQRPILTPGSDVHVWILPPCWQLGCSPDSSSGKRLVWWEPNGSGKCSRQMCLVPSDTSAAMRSGLESKGPAGIFQGCWETNHGGPAYLVLYTCPCMRCSCVFERASKGKADGCLQWPCNMMCVGTREWEEVCSFSREVLGESLVEIWRC